MRYFVVSVGLVLVALSACTSEPDDLQPGISPSSAEFARPKVTMEADPAPPHTYWAPEGSTIRNHPRDPETWIAEIDGQVRKYYFGDQCRASHYQHFVGHPMEMLPEPPAGTVWRFTCATCARTSDLGRARMNIVYEEDTRKIVEIDCG